MSGKKGSKKQWANQFYHMLKRGVPVREVKRKLYDDHEAHRKLGFKEEGLDLIWTALMDGTFDPMDKIRLRKTGKRKEFIKMARVVIQYDPQTNQEIKRFKSATEAAEATGVNYKTLTNIIYGNIKNPSHFFKYEDGEVKVPKAPKPFKKEVSSTPIKPLFKTSPKNPEVNKSEVQELAIDTSITVTTGNTVVFNPDAAVDLESARKYYIAALRHEATRQIDELEKYLVVVESTIPSK